MSPPVSLLFGVHAHQPVGNFPHVLDDAHLRCYQPFLRVLHRYPEFRFAAHFSGWLLDYLFDKYPQDMALLREMVARGQVELFGAGDTEPVLAVIPHRDRMSQINTFSDKLATRLGQRPQGAWLTERVWEATVIPALADCGMRYVTVDDYHFLCAGKAAGDLNGYFTTEEDGRRLDLFPISEALRYKLPFAPAHEALAYIEAMGSDSVGRDLSRHVGLKPDLQTTAAAAIYFDDIEKFGIWPETHQWVYGEGWLEKFIRGVLASPKIKTERFSDYHAAAKTRGIIYLPTVSYIEMNGWTLPDAAACDYAALVNESKAAGHYGRDKAFLRGGTWKNFFSRYPESNWMHKRMLALSARFAALPAPQRTPLMQQKLHETQSNDAYWHGLFGGLYLPHLRRAVYSALVELEALLDACAPRPPKFVEDTDLDGVEEIYLHNGVLQAVLKLDGDAALCEFDAYPLRHNFADTLRRQDEHYHHLARLGEASAHGGAGIVSAHDRVHFKHDIVAADMLADDHARGLFVDTFNAKPLRYRHETAGDGVVADFRTDAFPLSIKKTVAVQANTLQVRYGFTGEVEGVFKTEINLAMPSCDGMGGRFVHDGEIKGGFGQPLLLAALAEIALEDEVMKGKLTLKTSAPVQFASIAHTSVSQSEGGFEKIMQAVTLTLTWSVADVAGEMVVTLQVDRL